MSEELIECKYYLVSLWLNNLFAREYLLNYYDDGIT